MKSPVMWLFINWVGLVLRDTWDPNLALCAAKSHGPSVYLNKPFKRTLGYSVLTQNCPCSVYMLGFMVNVCGKAGCDVNSALTTVIYFKGCLADDTWHKLCVNMLTIVTIRKIL